MRGQRPETTRRCNRTDSVRSCPANRGHLQRCPGCRGACGQHRYRPLHSSCIRRGPPFSWPVFVIFAPCSAALCRVLDSGARAEKTAINGGTSRAGANGQAMTSRSPRTRSATSVMVPGSRQCGWTALDVATKTTSFSWALELGRPTSSWSRPD